MTIYDTELTVLAGNKDRRRDFPNSPTNPNEPSPPVNIRGDSLSSSIFSSLSESALFSGSKLSLVSLRICLTCDVLVQSRHVITS